MESLRDVKRVMEREIEKGSCPLQFEYLEFGEKPFQFIESEKKLNEVLSYLLRLGEYRGYTEHIFFQEKPQSGLKQRECTSSLTYFPCLRSRLAILP